MAILLDMKIKNSVKNPHILVSTRKLGYLDVNYYLASFSNYLTYETSVVSDYNIFLKLGFIEVARSGWP